MPYHAERATGQHDVERRTADSDDALIACLLGPSRSARTRATGLLAQAGSLRALTRVAGHCPLLSPAERDRVLAALELGRRALVERRYGQRLLEASAVVAWCRDLALSEVEVLLVAGLDAAGRILVQHRMVGAVDGVQARPRDLLRPVIAAGAVALVLAHNHPSGAPQPSASDVAFTRRLQTAAQVCGLALLDHVVVAGGGWSSMRALGHLEAAVGVELPQVEP